MPLSIVGWLPCSVTWRAIAGNRYKAYMDTCIKMYFTYPIAIPTIKTERRRAPRRAAKGLQREVAVQSHVVEEAHNDSRIGSSRASRLIFGPKNLPKLGSAIGKTVKNVREGMEEGDDDKAVSKTEKSNPSENVEEVVADPDDADVKVASSAK